MFSIKQQFQIEMNANRLYIYLSCTIWVQAQFCAISGLEVMTNWRQPIQYTKCVFWKASLLWWVYDNNDIFQALKYLGLTHFVKVKKGIQKMVSHEFTHRCGSICLWSMTLSVSPMARVKLHHFIFSHPLNRTCHLWIFITPEWKELQRPFTAQIVDNFQQFKNMNFIYLYH